MGKLIYSINVTLDGCVDHRVGIPTEETHRHAEEGIARVDAILLGRVTYGMMEDGWRNPSPDLPEWMLPFARTIDAAKKYVVTSTLREVDWNSEIVRGDLKTAVQKIKSQSPRGVGTGGVTLPLGLAELGLIDEYDIIVHPRIAGHGPRLFDSISKIVDLELVERKEFKSGAVALRYISRS
jgi:dihydrofolate reductase